MFVREEKIFLRTTPKMQQQQRGPIFASSLEIFFLLFSPTRAAMGVYLEQLRAKCYMNGKSSARE